MGISLHYQGCLDNIEILDDFIEEVADIAKSRSWDSHKIERDEEKDSIAGIIVNPGEGCEPLPFLFDKEGRLRCLADLITGEFDSRYSYYVSTKTQFTDIKTHIWIVGFLRYLKKKYITDLEVRDEGDYWETQSVETLRNRREFLAGKINELAEGLSKVTDKPDDLEGIAQKVEDVFRDLWEDSNPG